MKILCARPLACQGPRTVTHRAFGGAVPSSLTVLLALALLRFPTAVPAFVQLDVSSDYKGPVLDFPVTEPQVRAAFGRLRLGRRRRLPVGGGIGIGARGSSCGISRARGGGCVWSLASALAKEVPFQTCLEENPASLP